MTTASRSDELFERLLAHNPFTDNRVNAPSDDDVDVAELNRAAFERLTGLAREALRERRGIGAMLWGEAGVGKSHLLSRLDRWARSEGGACSIYVHNLLASPANLPRVLLRNVVGKLTWTERSSYSGTVLFQLLSTAISKVWSSQGFRTWSLLRQTLFDVLVGAAPAGPADAGLADPTVIDVLFRFYRSVLRRRQGKEDGTAAALAVQWLRGDPIPSGQAYDLLGLPPGRDADSPVQLEDAQQIKQVLVCLSRLTAACEQPFILAFDQVDNLEEQQASALARFLEAVIDSSRNLLAVTAGIQPSLMGWRDNRVIQDSAWDRIAQVQLQLIKLTPMQARQLLEVRLRHFFEPFEDAAEAQQMLFEDTLFPLGSRWFEQQLGQLLEVRPREILNAAREAWHREQSWLRQSGGPRWLADWKERQTSEDALLPPVSLTEFELNEIIDRTIGERMTEHAAAARGEQPDRESQAEVLAQLLEEQRRLDASSPLVRVLRPEEALPEMASAYHLFLDHRAADGSEVRTGVLLANSQSSNSVTNALSKARNDDTPLSRLLILAAEGGLALGEKGREHLEALEQREGCQVEVLNVPAAEWVTLDALNAVWNLARSEDLDVSLPDGRTRGITPDEVTRSHHRRGRFAQSPLLRTALASPLSGPGVSAPAAVLAPEPEPALAFAAVPMAMPGMPEPAPMIPLGSPVAEAAPGMETLLYEEPQLAMPVEAMPAELEQEAEAFLLEDESPAAAATVEEDEDAAEILLSEEPEAAEEEAEAILLNEDVEDEEGTILLNEEPEELEASVIDEEEAEAILLADEPAELDKTQEGVIELSEEDASALLLDDEQTPKMEL